MAKRTVNKSQEIRDYFGINPAASAKEVVAAMADKGIEVTEQTVATVKFKAGLTKSRNKGAKTTKSGNAAGSAETRKRGRPPGSLNKKTLKGISITGAGPAQADADHGLNIELLIDAKKLIHRAGSSQQAIEALKAINALDSIN